MKKINIVRSWLIGSFVLFGITSCTAGFEDANRPGHETSLEELGETTMRFPLLSQSCRTLLFLNRRILIKIRKILLVIIWGVT